MCLFGNKEKTCACEPLKADVPTDLDPRVSETLAEPTGDEHEGGRRSLAEANLLKGAKVGATVREVLALHCRTDILSGQGGPDAQIRVPKALSGVF